MKLRTPVLGLLEEKARQKRKDNMKSIVVKGDVAPLPRRSRDRIKEG
jgi:hypothetical protein